MKHQIIFRWILIPLLPLLVFGLLFRFATSGRNYNWAKEFNEEVNVAIKETDFKVVNIETINPDEVKLPTLIAIKLFVQQGFGFIRLLNLGGEYAEKYVLNSAVPSQEIRCKGRFAGDYLIGIEIDYVNVEREQLNNLKNKFQSEFPNYELIFTEK